MSGESRSTGVRKGACSRAVIVLTMAIAGAWSDLTSGQSTPDSHCQSEPLSGTEISLARAVDLALCRNAEVQSAAVAVRIRSAQLGQARSQYWPTLNASVSELRENTRYPGSEQSSTNDTAATLYGALTWRLFDFGARRADVRAASRLLEAAFASEDATIQRVLATVVQAYFDAVTADALVQSKAEDEALASQTVVSAEHRSERGDVAESDVLQAKSAHARSRLDLNRARAAYDKSLAVLVYSIGVPTETNIQLPSESESPPPPEIERALSSWLEEARRSHPAIVAARADVEAARARANSVRAGGKPTIDFQANYYANGFPQQGLAPTRQRSATFGIQITIPIFDGFLTRYKLHEAEATVSLKETALVDAERLTLTDIVKAYTDATTAIGDLRDSQELLQAVLASQRSSQRRYDSGAADILELLTVQSSLADARQERARSVADWRSARLRLLAASGLLMSVDLATARW